MEGELNLLVPHLYCWGPVLGGLPSLLRCVRPCMGDISPFAPSSRHVLAYLDLASYSHILC